MNHCITCFQIAFKGEDKQCFIPTIVHDCDGNSFARVAQLPSFCHIKVQPRGPVCLACVYLITQTIWTTCMTHGTQVSHPYKTLSRACVCTDDGGYG